MSMIRTAKRENPFVQLDKYFLEDESISFEAKGILAYVLSKPDTWTIRKNDLVKRSKSGRTRIETALLELMAAGYLNWYQERTENGTFGEWVYDVYERPEFNPDAEKIMAEGKLRLQKRKKKKSPAIKEDSSPKAGNQLSDSPKAGNPLSENPTSENQPYSNNDLSNNDLNNNELKKEDEEDNIYIGNQKNGLESSFSQTPKIELPTGMDIEDPKSDNQPLNRKIESESINQSSNKNVDDDYIKNLRSENLTFDFIYEFLTDKGLTKDTVYNVINQCHENGMELVTAKDVEKQYQHMMGKVRNEESIYDFSSYFVGGLKRRMEIALAIKSEAREEEARALLKGVKKVPFYNWLEERA